MKFHKTLCFYLLRIHRNDNYNNDMVNTQAHTGVTTLLTKIKLQIHISIEIFSKNYFYTRSIHNEVHFSETQQYLELAILYRPY